jgi:hypothetical protein
MRQCQRKDNVCSLIFFPHEFFYRNNYDILCCSFLLFSPHGLGVFAQAFVIYIFRFFPLGFSKIKFIICDVQVLKGGVTT